jgi:hypothetical protein
LKPCSLDSDSEELEDSQQAEESKEPTCNSNVFIDNLPVTKREI